MRLGAPASWTTTLRTADRKERLEAAVGLLREELRAHPSSRPSSLGDEPGIRKSEGLGPPDAEASETEPLGHPDAGGPTKRALADRESTRDFLESSLHGQQADPSWSYDQERRIEDALAKPESGAPRLLAVDCRTTFCGVYVQFAGREQGKQFLTALQHGSSPEFQNEFLMLADGWDDPEIELYLARDGEPLPVPGGDQALGP